VQSPDGYKKSMKTRFKRIWHGLTAIARPAALAALVLGGSGLVSGANAACRLALAIGLDISGSVDATEYRLQLNGLAGALLERDVQAVFLAMPGATVRLYVYEWGGISSQRVLLPWTGISSAEALKTVATTLRATRRQALEPATALGTAMLFGGAALAAQSDCWRKTIDLSGDGESNFGPPPQSVRRAAILADVTVNALAIGADAPHFSDIRQSEIAAISSYFRARVIRGPDVFVQTAIEFTGFQDAMARKLLKELRTRAVGALDGRYR